MLSETIIIMIINDCCLNSFKINLKNYILVLFPSNSRYQSKREIYESHQRGKYDSIYYCNKWICYTAFYIYCFNLGRENCLFQLLGVLPCFKLEEKLHEILRTLQGTRNTSEYHGDK